MLPSLLSVWSRASIAGGWLGKRDGRRPFRPPHRSVLYTWGAARLATGRRHQKVAVGAWKGGVSLQICRRLLRRKYPRAISCGAQTTTAELLESERGLPGVQRARLWQDLVRHLERHDHPKTVFGWSCAIGNGGPDFLACPILSVGILDHSRQLWITRIVDSSSWGLVFSFACVVPDFYRSISQPRHMTWTARP